MNNRKNEAMNYYPYLNRKVYKISNRISVERRYVFDRVFYVSVGDDGLGNDYLLVNLFNFRLLIKK